jgi:glycosyltransferase involved in cell wall biosynthesis
MHDKDFIKSLDKIIYVSEFQRAQFEKLFGVYSDKTVVIHNAIEPIEFIEKPTDKIRLIYTSMPNRGLDVLLDAFKLVPHKNVELHVYSSTIIYGQSYQDEASNLILQRCKKEPRVIYHGYATNKAVRKALQKANIFTYPSTFIETSCLAAIEAGAAGCEILTTACGALTETCSHRATYIYPRYSRKELVESYAAALVDVINAYDPMNPRYSMQSKWFNDSYSWEVRKHKWQKILKEL